MASITYLRCYSLPFALNRQWHGQNEIIERVVNIDLVTEIGSFTALADDDDHGLINGRGTGTGFRVPNHPHALDRRLLDSLLKSDLIKKADKPLAVLVLAVHWSLLFWSGNHRIRIPDRAIGG